MTYTIILFSRKEGHPDSMRILHAWNPFDVFFNMIQESGKFVEGSGQEYSFKQIMELYGKLKHYKESLNIKEKKEEQDSNYFMYSITMRMVKNTIEVFNQISRNHEKDVLYYFSIIMKGSEDSVYKPVGPIYPVRETNIEIMESCGSRG